jgi:hypothetical protein
MAVTIQNIDPNASISLAPAIINQNFANVKAKIDAFEGLFNTTDSKIRLSNKATTPSKSYEGDSITLVATSGVAIAVIPDGDTGGVTKFSVTFDGKVAALKYSATGTGSDKSTFADLASSGQSDFTHSSFNGKFDISKSNSIYIDKHTGVVLTSANIGSGATTPLDPSKLGLALLDADNGGGVLDGNPTAAIKLDVTNVIENQLVEFRLYRKNGGQSIGFYNGTPGSEVFAKINHSSGGYVSIADTTTPTFDDTQDVCAVKLKYIQITTGVYRFVILEAVNFNY